MLRFTSPLLANNIKIGENLPKNSIEIAKFNVNKKNDESLLQSDSLFDIDINYSYGKEVIKYKSLNNLSEKNDTLFPLTTEYISDTYNGVLYRNSVSYKEFKRKVFEKDMSLQREYNLSSDLDIPSSITVTESGASCELHATSIQIKDSSKTVSNKTYSSCFPVFVAKVSNEYLTSNNSYNYISLQSQSIGCIKTETTESVIEAWLPPLANGTFQADTIHNSYSYIFTGETREKTIETWVKHYGICRYWGGGGSSSNNYYGDPDYRFRVNGWTAKGYMNDKLPAPTLWRYGREKNVVCRHRPEKYPVDVGGFWTTNVGELKGIAWTYDIEEAAKYGGSTDKSKGGAVWASAFEGKKWPPSGYETDHTGSAHYKLYPGNNKTINPTGKVITKNGAQKTSTAGFYNYGGWYCKWFRDVVLFYKGKTVKTVKDGRYESIILNHKGPVNITSECILAYKKKDEQVSIEDGIKSLSVIVTYNGKLYKDEIKYHAVAKYVGKVYKNYKLKQMDYTSFYNELAFVNNNGYIETLSSGTNLLSPYVELTDYEVDGEPLFYKYRCLNNVQIYSEKQTIVTTERIALINNSASIKHLFIANKVFNNLYSLDILTSTPICYSDNVFVEFSNDKNNIKERICTSLLYKQGIDYNIVYKDNEYKCRFGEISAQEDSREKVSVSFKIKTSSGTCSNIYTFKIVSKNNAISQEKANFKQNMLLIDIYDNEKNLLTAREIVERDSNKTIGGKETFTVEIISSSSLCDPYVDIYGNGPVYIETNQETTFDKESYKVKTSVDGFIRNGFIIKESSNAPFALLKKPNGHEPLFISVRPGTFYATGKIDQNTIKAKYTVKDSNIYAEIGSPFIKRKEYLKVTSKEIFPSYKMLCDSSFIKVSSLEGKVDIEYISQKNNKIKVKTNAKHVTIEYYEIKTCTDYKGIVSENKTYILDLNTGVGHEYYNWNNNLYESSSNLNGKIVYVFLKPNIVSIEETGEIIKENDISNSIYHSIDNPYPDDVLDSLLATIYISDGNNNKINVQKSSTIGGGLKDKYLYKYKGKLSSIFDTSDNSYIPIRKTGVLITDVDPITVSKEDVKSAANDFIPVGTLNIIRSVKNNAKNK